MHLVVDLRHRSCTVSSYQEKIYSTFRRGVVNIFPYLPDNYDWYSLMRQCHNGNCSNVVDKNRNSSTCDFYTKVSNAEGHTGQTRAGWSIVNM